MSEAAISAQIVSESAPASSASGSNKLAQSTLPEDQTTDFTEILNALSADTRLSAEQLAELTAEQQALPGINELLATNAVATEVNGKQLPPLQQIKQLATAQGNKPDALLAANIPVEGRFSSSVTALLPADENPLAIKQGAELDSDLFTSQLTTNFTEKNLPNIKQLNAQVLSQLMQQAQPDKTASFDNAVLSGSAPGIMVNQSLTMTSSEAVLPPITVSPDNPQFNAHLGERINWMVNNNIQRADIRLDPPELGNLDVRLHIAKDQQANIVFHVSNATAKEAIESAIPRLREMFEQQGLDLGNVNVSQQGPQHQQSAFSDQNDFTPNHHEPVPYGSNNVAEDSILAVTNLESSSNNNLLDIFA